MIIVSQDKKAIHNFDNIMSLQVEKKNCSSIDYTYLIIVYDSIDDGSSIGEYKTEERAKEVLNQIRSIYSAFKIFEITRNKTQDECALKIVEANIIPFVFEMPEE